MRIGVSDPGVAAIVTLIIVALTCVISYFAFNNEKIIRDLIFWPPALSRDRQYYRLISYGLIHADGQHLIFNMVTLYFFGGVIERLLTPYIGETGFVLFYAGALVASILPTWWQHRNDAMYRSLGASGAVSAVLFAFILVQPWATILVFFIPVPAIIYAVLYLGYTMYMNRQNRDNINHSAHLWGAAYGVIFMLVMEPRTGGVFLQRLLQPGF